MDRGMNFESDDSSDDELGHPKLNGVLARGDN